MSRVRKVTVIRLALCMLVLTVLYSYLDSLHIEMSSSTIPYTSNLDHADSNCLHAYKRDSIQITMLKATVDLLHFTCSSFKYIKNK